MSAAAGGDGRGEPGAGGPAGGERLAGGRRRATDGEDDAGLVVRIVTVPPFAENSFLVGCRSRGAAVLVDPGGEVPTLLETATELELDVSEIWLTHAHADHVAGVAQARRLTGAPVLLHPDDRFLYDAAVAQAATFGLDLEEPPPPDRELAAGQTLSLGRLEAEVLHVPGHSPGHVAFWFSSAKAVFSGDCLFAGSIGRTDLPGGSYDTLIRSIRQRLFTLGDEVRVYAGHGPPTTVGRERRENPFFQN